MQRPSAVMRHEQSVAARAAIGSAAGAAAQTAASTSTTTRRIGE
jgi:hypothetical protein